MENKIAGHQCSQCTHLDEAYVALPGGGGRVGARVPDNEPVVCRLADQMPAQPSHAVHIVEVHSLHQVAKVGRGMLL